MENARKPKTYLDRDVQTNKNFIFVSYAHKDRIEVYEILRELYDKGANYWYDTELVIGDQWNERVKERLYDNKCMGVLWFISENSILSDAVFKELKIYSDLNKANPKFILIPISLKNKDFLKYLDDIPNKTADTLEKFYYYMQEILKGLSILYNFHENIDKTGADVLKTLASVNSLQEHNVNIRGSKINEINGFYNKAGEYFVDCGEYTDIEIDNINPVQNPKEKTVIIKWKLIYDKDDKYYFISEKCIDFLMIDELDRVLNDLENEIKKTIPAVERVSLPTENILEKYKNIIGHNKTTDFADYKRLQPLKLFWVDSEEGNKCFYNYNNAKISRTNMDINAGIRPMLMINTKKIKGD